MVATSLRTPSPLGRAEYDACMNEPTDTTADPPAPIEVHDAPRLEPARRSRVGGLLRILGIVVAMGLLIVLTLQNTDPVSLNLFVWTVTLSRALLVFALLVIGAVIGWVLRSMRDDDGFRLLG